MKTYTAIPGLGTGARSFHVGMRQRLYQASDHLLLVHSSGFTDDFRRFYFRDITAVVVRRTSWQLWIGVVVGIFVAGMLALLAYAWRAGLGAPGLGFIVGILLIFLVVFVVNLVLGPTCVCYVSTRVQTAAVPTPRRVGRVGRLIDFLRARNSELSAAPTASA